MKTDFVPEKILRDIVQRVNFKMSLDDGEKLRHVRLTEIPDELCQKLKEIGSKANAEGVFTEGAITWGDFYNFAEAVWKLTLEGSNESNRKILFYDDVQDFIERNSGSEETKPSDSISPARPKSVLIGNFKVHATSQGFGEAVQLAISPYGASELVKSMTGEVYEKITSAGLPLIKNTWLWKS